MYVHVDCPAVGSRRGDGKPDGIYMHGTASVSLNTEGGRRFYADTSYLYNMYVESIECLDCEREIVSYVEPCLLDRVEHMLEKGSFSSKIEWVE